MSAQRLKQFLHQIKQCSKQQRPVQANKLHAHLLKSGAHLHGPFFPNTLLNVYGKCGHFNDALQLFDEMPLRDLASWSSLFTAYNNANMPRHTIISFSHMLHDNGVPPDHFVFATLVKACASLGALEVGQQLHALFFVSQFSDDDVVKSSLVDFYAKCGLPDEAWKVFDSIVSKNTVSWTSLMYGYARMGRKHEAVELLREMPCKNSWTWAAAISGFIQGGYCDESFRIFSKLRRDGVDKVEEPHVLSSLVVGSTSLASLELGKQVHGLAIHLGYASNEYVSNALIDMYAKCSEVSSAEKIFGGMKKRDIVAWTSIIVGMAQHGQGEEALSMYNEMISAGLRPNEVTFTGVIYACSHVGLVEKGRELFNSMVNDYGLRPTLQHYTCLVDLYSRSGHLEEAEKVLNSMPFKPDEATWAALLSACMQAGKTNTGVRIADHLLKLGPEWASTCVLMSNIYARCEMWEKVSTVRKLMTGMELKKKPGYSCVDLGNEKQVFYAGETLHPMTDEVFNSMKELDAEMRKRGYVPDTSVVLHNMEQQEKERQLFWHSERQAVAYGLIKSTPGKLIRIIKNLRVCSDCHTALKLISCISRREIVVRDANRYHHFKDGACSCRDFW